MRYQSLGRSGLQVSVIGLGCNNFGSRLDLARTRSVLDAAIDRGITLLDTADVYGARAGDSETLMGEALQGHRDQVVLATKFGHRDHDAGYGPAGGAKGGRAYVRRAVEESLRRLRTDHIDLYQLHTPDPSTPIAETLGALHELVLEGKVRYVGSSNFSGWQIAEAAHVADESGFTAFVSAQNEWSLLQRGVEAEVVPAATHYGVGVLPYFPLANGLLTGKVGRDVPPPPGSRLSEPRKARLLTEAALETVDALAAFARERGRTLLQLAFAWLLAHEACGSVIAGATTAEQVRANAAATDWELDASDLAALDPLLRPVARA